MPVCAHKSAQKGIQMNSHERLAVSVNTACDLLGISRTTLYQLVKGGDLSIKKIGRRSVLLTADLSAFVEQLSTSEKEEGR